MNSTAPETPMPAQQISRSIPPAAAVICSAAACRVSGLVTSASMWMTPGSPAPWRLRSYTRSPRAANRFAAARPMPELAPVMTTVWGVCVCCINASCYLISNEQLAMSNFGACGRLIEM